MRSAARLLIAAVALASCAASAQEPPAPSSGPELRVTVAVDLSGLPERTIEKIDALGLESRVILRLLQEGFAVVAPFARPHVLLRAQDQDGNVKLVAQAGNTEEAVTVSLASGTRAELQLEIAQKLVDLARSRAQFVAEVLARPPPQPTGTDQPPPPRAIIIPQVPPPPKREYSAVELSAGVDALWRGAVDPLFRAGLSISGESIIGVGLTGGFSPSGAAPDLTVREWQLAVGPRFRLLAVNEVRVHGSVMFGGMTHHFVATGEGADVPSGERLDVLMLIPVELEWKVRDWLGLGVRLAPGIAGRAREHRREGEIRWRREAARLEGGATLSFKL